MSLLSLLCGVCGAGHTYNTAPTYIGKYGYSATVHASGTGAISVGVPTSYQSGDLLVLLLQGQSGYPATPSGWTSLDTQTYTDTYFRVCYKWAGASESAVTVADSGDSTRGLMLCSRGVDVIVPIDVSAKNTDYGTPLNASGLTTTVPNCLIIIAIGFEIADSTYTDSFSSWSNASLASITEGHDLTDTAGSGGGIAFAYGVKATAGTVNETTATADSHANQAIIAFALTPAA